MADQTLLAAFESNVQGNWAKALKDYQGEVVDLSNAEIEFPDQFFNYDQINIDFAKSVFNKNPVIFTKVRTETKYVLDGCIFNVKVEFLNKLNGSLVGATFNKEVHVQNPNNGNFSKSEFNADCKFTNCSRLNINNAIFNKKVTFLGNFQVLQIKLTLFKEDVSFAKSNFHNGINLSESIFKGSVSFAGSELNGFTYFLGCIFYKAPDFHDTTLFEGTDFSAAIFKDTKSKYAYNNYRTLKNQMNKFQEYYEASRFYALEQESLMRKILWKRGNIWNSILLLMNDLSNKHNQSWSRGVAFTFITGLIFYLMLLLALGEPLSPTSEPNSQRFWELAKGFLIFMFPVHDIDFLKMETTFWSNLIDYVGRIFIGYGIYQTIQAFRKFGRK